MKWKKDSFADKFLLLLLLGSLYLMAHFGFYQIEESNRRTLEWENYQKTALHLQERIQPLKSSKISQYSQKNGLTERILRAYASRIGDAFLALKKKTDVAKPEFLQRIKRPFASILNVTLAHQGKVKGQSKYNFEPLFGKDWSSLLLGGAYNLARSSKSELSKFEFNLQLFRRGAEALFTFPMTLAEFESYFNTLSTIYHFSSSRLLYLFPYQLKTEDQELMVILILDTAEVTESEIAKELLNQSLWDEVSSEYSAGEKDIFQAGSYTRESFTQTGLRFDSKPGSFRLFLASQSFFHGLFLILCLFVLRYGGISLFNRRFEFQFALLYALFLFLIGWLSSFLFKQMLNNKNNLMLTQIQQNFRENLNHMEGSFEEFRGDLFKKVHKQFSTPDIFDPSVFTGGLVGLRVSPITSVVFSDMTDAENFTKEVLCIATPMVIGMQPETEQRYFTLSHRQRVQAINDDNIMNLNDARGQTYWFYSYNRRSWNELIQEIPQIFAPDRQKDVVSLTFLEEGYFFSWQKQWKNKIPHYLAAGISAGRLYPLYFADPKHKNFPFSFATQRIQRAGTLNTNSDLGANLFRFLWEKYGARENLVFEFQNRGEPYFGSFTTSTHFHNQAILLFTPKQHLTRSLESTTHKFYLFQICFFALALLAGRKLSQILIEPTRILRRGFARINHNELNFSLPITGKDEGAEVLHQFNLMTKELLSKRKMAPFVSEAVNHLFSKLDGEQGAIEGDAVLLFSDIRSFTTLSETYDAKEIVEMLNDYFSIWQPVVEKRGGIIIRFIGDAVNAVFLKDLNPNYVADAVYTAHDVMLAVNRFNQRRETDGRFSIKNGIGLAHGKIHFTLIGNQEKTDFFILGDAPEIAETMEAESKQGKHMKIILDEMIYRKTMAEFEYAEFETKEYPDQKFYELIGLRQ